MLTAEFLPAATSAKPTNEFVKPKVQLRPMPKIKLKEQPPLTDKEIAEIKQHIRNLAKIDSPDFGLSPTMSGSAFAPIAGMQQTGAFLLTNHQLKTSDDFVQLVKLGPKALPYLLDSLADQTETKLVMKHDAGIGIMWFDREL